MFTSHFISNEIFRKIRVDVFVGLYKGQSKDYSLSIASFIIL